MLGNSTDDDDASDSCEFFDAQGGDTFDLTSNNYLVNCQPPNIMQHKSLSSTQVFYGVPIEITCNIKQIKNFRL